MLMVLKLARIDQFCFSRAKKSCPPLLYIVWEKAKAAHKMMVKLIVCLQQESFETNLFLLRIFLRILDHHIISFIKCWYKSRRCCINTFDLFHATRKSQFQDKVSISSKFYSWILRWYFGVKNYKAEM